MAKKNKIKETGTPWFNSQTWRLTIVVVLVTLAIILFLGLVNLAGSAGEFLTLILKVLFGWASWSIPVILIILAVFVLNYQRIEEKNKETKNKYPRFGVRIGGLFYLVLILSSLFHIYFVNNKTALLEHQGGGYLGYGLSYIIVQTFGIWAGWVILLGAFFIGLIVVFIGLNIFKKQPLEQETGQKNLFFRNFFGRLKPVFKIRKKEKLILKPEATDKLLTEMKEEEREEDKGEEIPVKTKKKGFFTSKREEAMPISFSKISQKIDLPLNLLENDSSKPNAGDIKENRIIIQKTLENFNIPVEMGEIKVGPTVTQYTLKPANGIKLSQITSLHNDLALALAAHPIRIEAPIPGQSLVGIEVPNQKVAVIRLRQILADEVFIKRKSNLTIALGRDVAGSIWLADLDRMPHLLVAGATGSGKTCAADTLMFTEKGMLTFEELCSLPLNSEMDFKVKLVTRDGIETTAKNYNNGICQFYKLSTRRGYQIEATSEHPLWVMNEDGRQSWKAASLIKKGDYVAISRGPALFGNKIDFSDFKPSKIKAHYREISFPSKMTPQLGQFLGLLSANGRLLTERRGIHRVVYTQTDSRLIRFYKKCLKELFGITQFIEKKSNSNPKNKAKGILINSKHLKEFLVYLGMDSYKSPQKEIPRAIREAPKEIVVAYLKALFDNDGYIGKNSIELCISSKKLVSQVQLMLLNFGIVSSLSLKKVKNYARHKYYRLFIFGEEARKFVQEIGFIRKEKYNKAKGFLNLSPNPNFDSARSFLNTNPEENYLGIPLTMGTSNGVDLIPHISSLLKRISQKYLNRFRLTNRGWKYQSEILVPKYAFGSLRSYNAGFRAPGYQALEKFLEFYQSIPKEFEYQQLMRISERNFYWDKIEKIDRTSGVGYDFYVPGSDSFVGNGFVNHNTIFLNSVIISLIYQNSPDDLRFILVDPKRVELTLYNDLPHLLTPVITNVQKTINALKWAINEMERRFDIMAEAKKRDIHSYNQANSDNKLPYIVIIIDELADLMVAAAQEIETCIVRLAQMARATGIHLVMATQRPSVDIITGLIKANITARVAFSVASLMDSRTILDFSGAEKLLGRGDMLFISAELSKPKRLQGAYVSDEEVRKVVEYLRNVSEPNYQEDITSNQQININIGQGDLTGDELLPQAREMIIQTGKASASFLQRRLRIGYARAARLLDLLEEEGTIGPADGAKPREVYKSSKNTEDVI